MERKRSLRKFLSAFIALAMVMSAVLPVAVFATVATPTAVATVSENAGGGQTKTIAVTFESAVTDLGAILDTDIYVSGKTFGASSMALDATQKELLITLANDATVAVGENITFANDKIADALDPTDFFNGDVSIIGSLDTATIDYSGIVPGDATIEIDGYLTNPTSVGTGTFNYTLTRTDYVTKNGSFSIEASDLGTTYTVTDSMEKNSADYTLIDAKIIEAGTYIEANYTAASYSALQTALTNANAVDRTLKFDEQSTVDALATALQNAIDGLVAIKSVGFMAVAVADDADVNYAKATKIVLVFAEPIELGADILSNLSIKDDIESAAWVDAENTIYELTIKSAANLTNGTTITYTKNETIKTKLGEVPDTVSATVAGNLEEASALVTATDMSATIVKSSGKPGITAGDKIVIVFNAPVKDNPATITVNGMTANAVASTNNTVYEIVLAGTESVSDTTTLTYSTMSAGLNGSFGSAVAPVVKKVIAVDNDGTAKTEGDQIIVSFDRPTNGIAISSDALANIVTKAGQGLGGDATAVWNASKTELTINIGKLATINDDVIINLGSLGIMDEYGIVAYTGENLDVEGSFGTAIAPKITRAIAFTQNNKHKIRVFFNTLVEPKPGLSVYVQTFNLGTGSSEKWINNGITYYDLELGDDHQEFITNTYSIVFDGIIADSTGKSEATDLTAVITGGFEQDIDPEILSLTAYSADGSGIAQVGDKIVLVMNSEVTSVDSTLTGNFTTTDKVTWTYTISSQEEVTISQEVTFNFVARGKAYNNLKANIGGSFGYVVTPKFLSATAYSKQGVGIQQQGDELILVFDAAVKDVILTTSIVGTPVKVDDEGCVWKVVLGSTPDVVIGTTISVTAKSVATDKTISGLTTTIGGSFGKEIKPGILSATAYSIDGSGVAKVGDKIVVVFNAAVKDVTSTNFGVGTTSDNYTWTFDITNTTGITLGATEIVCNATSIATNTTTTNLKHIIDGSFGNAIDPEILSATAVSNDGSGVAKAGDKIIVVFNTPVEVTANELGSISYSDDKTVWTITLTANTSATVGVTNVEFENVKNIKTGVVKSVVSKVLGGSFGYSDMPVVKSVVLAEANGIETIKVVFDGAIDIFELDGITKKSVNIETLKENNDHLGTTITAKWVDEYILEITLGADATTSDTSKLNLTGLGIKAKVTGIALEDAAISDLKIKGTLIPVVNSVFASGKNIVITFSTRTNGYANISSLTTLLGTGAKTAWSDYNKTLTITLGENYTITNNGYLVFNGMGIKDAFSGKYLVVGQYKVNGSIETEKLVVSKVVAQSTDKSSVVAKKGDKIIIKFNSATDTKGMGLNNPANVDDIVTVAGGNEKAFGTGYTGMWTAYDTFEIVLGGSTVDPSDPSATIGNDPDIAIGDTINVSGVSFANGQGTMDATDVNIGGSFDGREFVITNGSLVQLGANNTGDYRISMKIENTLLNTSIIPTIVCVAYNNTLPVSISRMTVDVVNSIQPTFEFYGSKVITSAKIYVFSEEFADASSSPEVLAETVEIK